MTRRPQKAGDGRPTPDSPADAGELLAGDPLAGDPLAGDPLAGDLPRASRLAPALSGVLSWMRMRIILFGALMLLGMGLLLDMIFTFLLPVPREVATNSRLDILLSLPVLLLVLVAVTALWLRPVARALTTLRLRLALPHKERRRALGAALSFPVAMSFVLAGVGSLGNLATLAVDLLGRASRPWDAVYITAITQCVIVCSAFPVFVFTRFTLRPFVLAVASDTESLGRSLGLRGRIAFLVTTLVALVVVPISSLLALQLDRRARMDREVQMGQVVAFLGQEMREMGVHSFGRYVASMDVEDSMAVFVQDDAGLVTPAVLGELVRAGALGSPGVALTSRLPKSPSTPRPPWLTSSPAEQAGHGALRREVDGKILMARPVALAGGGSAWVGIAFRPWGGLAQRKPLIALGAAMLVLALIIAMLMGAGVVRELVAVAGRLEAVSAGRSPDPLSAEVGSVAEVGHVIDAINALLGAADRARVLGYLEVEASAALARSRIEFLANMSHDLKSPLTAILGFVELLGQEHNGPLDLDQRQKIHRIARVSTSLVAFIDLLLDSAKQDAGRLKLQRAWTPVATLLSRAMSLLSSRVGSHQGRNVATRVEPGLAPIHVDPERTGQALAYLLEELLAAGPEVTLSVQAGRYAKGRDRGIEIQVFSQGPTSFQPCREDLFAPLREEGQRRIFNAGLALARQILVRQGGSLLPFPAPGDRKSSPDGPDSQKPLASSQEPRGSSQEPRGSSKVGFHIRFPVHLSGELAASRERE